MSALSAHTDTYTDTDKEVRRGVGNLGPFALKCASGALQQKPPTQWRTK